MSAFDTLPIILISAVNEVAASTFISELVDNDVTDEYLKDKQTPDRIWRLVNKYYTANVRVHFMTDHGRLQVNPDSIEAHVIYITEEEVSEESGGVTRAAARAAASGGVWRRCGVRVLAADCAAEPAALAAWAGAHHADAVALREPAALAEPAGPLAEPAGPLAEPAGVARARAALHAHEWRGLLRTDRAHTYRHPESPCGSSESSEEGEEGGEGEEGEEQRAVEQAEAFAAALGALGGALEAAPAERRQRAEALVHAFCRALGYDLDAC